MLCDIFLLVFGAQIALAAPDPVSKTNLNSRQSSTITVDLDQKYQKMDGFGFSQAFGTAYTIMNLPAVQQKQALDFLFNKTTGAGLTILRNGINVDMIEPTNPGSATAAATYAWDDSDGAQVWVSQQAQTYGVSTFYADSWSAPAFMKTNDDESNGGYLCGVTDETCSSGDWKQAYANLIVQYIKDYQSVGVQITQVGFLNEPDINATYSSMLSDGTQAADFIKILYPSLQAAGLDVGIVCCDAAGWDSQEAITAQLISAGVEGMLSRITSHSYSSAPTSPMDTTLPVWETEYCDLSGSFSTTWYSTGDLTEGMAWANLIYTGVVNANLSAYLHWYGVDNTGEAGCLVNVNGTDVEPSAKLWAFAQWSRFVQPGAIRLGTSSSGLSNVQVSAFENTDGSVSVQILNNGASDQSLSVKTTGGGFTAGAAKAYITNNSNLSVAPYSASISGGTVSTSIPAYSMVTIVLTSGGNSGGGTSTKTTSATSTSSSSSKTSATGTQAHWNQCGGIGYSGPTQCQPPYSCSSQNAWYSQCL